MKPYRHNTANSRKREAREKLRRRRLEKRQEKQVVRKEIQNDCQDL